MLSLLQQQAAKACRVSRPTTIRAFATYTGQVMLTPSKNGAMITGVNRIDGESFDDDRLMRLLKLKNDAERAKVGV